MKTKMGFTLVELLATIVILGIVSLIAIPAVNKMVQESKEKAFEESINNIVLAIQIECRLQQLDNKMLVHTYSLSDGKITPEVDIKGKIDGVGEMNVNNKCEVSFTSINNGVYTASKVDASSSKILFVKNDSSTKPEEENVSAPSTYTVGEPVYYNPDNKNYCNESSAISLVGTKSGCMKWYPIVISDTTVSMILDHNTSTNVVYNSSGTSTAEQKEIATQLQTDTQSWDSSLSPRLITGQEIANIIGYTAWTQTSTDGFYLDTHTKTLPSSYNYGWLYDRLSTNCKTSGCLNNAEETTDTTDMSGYWTSTPRWGSVWRIEALGKMGVAISTYIYDGSSSTMKIGVRPVITITK